MAFIHAETSQTGHPRDAALRIWGTSRSKQLVHAAGRLTSKNFRVYWGWSTKPNHPRRWVGRPRVCWGNTFRLPRRHSQQIAGLPK